MTPFGGAVSLGVPGDAAAPPALLQEHRSPQGTFDYRRTECQLALPGHHASRSRAAPMECASKRPPRMRHRSSLAASSASSPHFSQAAIRCRSRRPVRNAG